jgi:uncharacterized cofD-like protein
MGRRRSFLATARHWLAPGIGVKRWLAVLVLGASMMGLGVIYVLLAFYLEAMVPEPLYRLLVLAFLPVPLRIVLPLVLGLLLLALGIARLSRNLLEPFRRPGDSVGASRYRHVRRGRGPAIVAIGGGTGMPSLLRGIKEFTSNITAVVTVADDGGSSGRLRQELGLLPPGDFRNNIAALAEDEALMTHVMQYRFGGALDGNGQGELRGHAFGNLLLAALAGVTGSFDEGLIAAERVLAVQGRVLPATLDQVFLVAEVVRQAEDGSTEVQRVEGESAIPLAGGRIEQIYLEPTPARAYPPAIQAILQADLVVMGPGSLYTSIVPNLLVPGIAQAIRHTRAIRVYVCNIAVQPGETHGYSLSDHVRAIDRVLGGNYLDVVVANDRLALPQLALEERERTVLVEPLWSFSRRDTRLVTADLVDETRPWRHDSLKLAGILKRIAGGEANSQFRRL